MELKCPTKVSELQTFLGMVIHFLLFIPYFVDICGPLFQLLKKGIRWKWETDEKYAWLAAKNSLQMAPLLGHPIEGQPYWLYTDTSDKALGCALQQVQKIKVQELAGTKAYDLLSKAWEKWEAMPRLYAHISDCMDNSSYAQQWGESLDETEV